MIQFPESFKFFESLVEGLKILSTAEIWVLAVLGGVLIAFAGFPFLWASAKERRVMALVGVSALVTVPVIAILGLYINLVLVIVVVLGVLTCLGRGMMFLIRGN
jgi:hypothetical protein